MSQLELEVAILNDNLPLVKKLDKRHRIDGNMIFHHPTLGETTARVYAEHHNSMLVANWLRDKRDLAGLAMTQLITSDATPEKVEDMERHHEVLEHMERNHEVFGKHMERNHEVFGKKWKFVGNRNAMDMACRHVHDHTADLLEFLWSDRGFVFVQDGKVEISSIREAIRSGEPHIVQWFIRKMWNTPSLNFEYDQWLDLLVSCIETDLMSCFWAIYPMVSSKDEHAAQVLMNAAKNHHRVHLMHVLHQECTEAKRDSMTTEEMLRRIWIARRDVMQEVHSAAGEMRIFSAKVAVAEYTGCINEKQNEEFLDTCWSCIPEAFQISLPESNICESTDHAMVGFKVTVTIAADPSQMTLAIALALIPKGSTVVQCEGKDQQKVRCSRYIYAH